MFSHRLFLLCERHETNLKSKRIHSVWKLPKLRLEGEFEERRKQLEGEGGLGGRHGGGRHRLRGVWTAADASEPVPPTLRGVERGRTLIQSPNDCVLQESTTRSAACLQAEHDAELRFWAAGHLRRRTAIG